VESLLAVWSARACFDEERTAIREAFERAVYEVILKSKSAREIE
jgi:hypothetical protein